jgi:hypothetical protein
MTVQPMLRRRLVASLIGVGLAVGACGGSAATAAPVTPVPTIAAATATSAPTASPTPAPSSSANPTASAAASAAPVASDSPGASAASGASASAAVDPASNLAIASPYSIVTLDAATATAMQTSIEQGMGAYAGLIHVGTREVAKSGKLAAYVMVLAFPTGTLTDATYQAVLAGMSASATGAFTSNTVSTTTVSTGTMSTVNVGIYRAGDAVMVVLALDKTEVLPIATALISSN